MYQELRRYLQAIQQHTFSLVILGERCCISHLASEDTET